MTPLRVLHVLSHLDLCGRSFRIAALANAFGKGASHAFGLSEPHRVDALAWFDKNNPPTILPDFPDPHGTAWPSRLQQLARAMQGHDLVLTYGSAGIGAALAHTLFADAWRLPPLVHHEDALEPGGRWKRRIALGRSRSVVVVSEPLEHLALDDWAQPMGRVRLIPNGVDTSRFRLKPKPNAIPRVIKHEGELWLGTVAMLRPDQNMPELVKALSRLPEFWHLVIVGDGPERERIRNEAIALDVGHRVHLPGFLADPAPAYALFDLFAYSSQSAQCPHAVMEAMAAGLAVTAPASGDVMSIVDESNRSFITPIGDGLGLSAAIEQLAADGARAKRIGEANRVKACEEFEFKRIVERYRATYAAALGQSRFP